MSAATRASGGLPRCAPQLPPPPRPSSTGLRVCQAVVMASSANWQSMQVAGYKCGGRPRCVTRRRSTTKRVPAGWLLHGMHFHGMAHVICSNGMSGCPWLVPSEHARTCQGEQPEGRVVAHVLGVDYGGRSCRRCRGRGSLLPPAARAAACACPRLPLAGPLRRCAEDGRRGLRVAAVQVVPINVAVRWSHLRAGGGGGAKGTAGQGWRQGSEVKVKGIGEGGGELQGGLHMRALERTEGRKRAAWGCWRDPRRAINAPSRCGQAAGHAYSHAHADMRQFNPPRAARLLPPPPPLRPQ